jgi:chitin synthase
LSHFIDKSFEAVFGFISVLPGAYCMFRWKAIKGDPLSSFFHGLDKTSHTPYEANMFLAEDRIMCLEILVKAGERNYLSYVPGSVALTDPPSKLSVLFKQRRRWINGSLFASLHVLSKIFKIFHSNHTIFSKFFVFLLYIYMLFNMVFQLLLVGSLASSFYIFIVGLTNVDDINSNKCYAQNS